MIEINLLPEGLRKKKAKHLKLPHLPALPIIYGIIGFLILIQLILVFTVQVKKVTLNSLNKKFTSISAGSGEAKILEDKLKELLAKVDAVEKLSSARFNWAKNLNDLSDSLVSGIWLRRLYIKKVDVGIPSTMPKQLLVIEGSSIVSGEGEAGCVGDFVNSLKENKEFSEGFHEIELTRVERRKIRHTEAIDFIITCYFKEGRGS